MLKETYHLKNKNNEQEKNIEFLNEKIEILLLENKNLIYENQNLKKILKNMEFFKEKFV